MPDTGGNATPSAYRADMGEYDGAEEPLLVQLVDRYAEHLPAEVRTLLSGADLTGLVRVGSISNDVRAVRSS